MKKECESNVISLSKIWENLKKYFWVVIICLIASLGISLVVEGNTKEETVVNERRVYASDIHIKVNWNIEGDIKDEASLLYCKEDNTTLAKYISTTECVSLLNTKLAENNYPLLAANEKILYEASSYNMIRIVVCGYAENGRIEFILNTLAQILDTEAKELYGDVSVEPISTPKLQNVKESNGNYSLIYGTVVDPDQVANQTPIQTYNWKQNTNFIIYILAGAVFGIFVLFMIMVFDNKVYVESEISQILNMPCIGNMKSEAEREVLLEKIIGRSKKNSMTEIGVLFIGKAGTTVSVFQEYIQAEGIKLELFENIEKSGEAMRRLSRLDNVVIGIELKKIHKDQVIKCKEMLAYVGIELIGYFVF